MDNHNEQKGFSYTYSAKEQAEIRRIRDKYQAPKTAEDKMARLRRLDARVTEKARAVALTLGILGTLILGTGMSLIMSDLRHILDAYPGLAMPLGIALGLSGGTLAAVAYPVYDALVRRERARIAPEILRLSEELLK